MSILAAITIIPLLLSNGKPIAVYKEPIRGLAWTRDGQLLTFTKYRVHEWPSGRSAKLNVKYNEHASYLPHSSFTLDLNASQTQGIGDGFLLDLETLRSRLLPDRAIWDSDSLVRVQEIEYGRYHLIRGKKVVEIAKGWHVAGISRDGKFALVNKKAPSGGDDTWLMKIGHKTGAVSRIARFPKSSDDHDYLGAVSFNKKLGLWLIHKVAANYPGARPFLSGHRLRPIEVGFPLSEVELSCSVSWVEPGSPWTFAERWFYDNWNNGSIGLDAYSFDLFNVRTRKTIRLAKQINRWRSNGSTTTPDRLTAPVLSAPALDWKRKQFAYAVQNETGSRIYLMSIPHLVK